ncbi:MAG: hypothetical protein OK439_04195 [Thaumarchaeota archaeon]|nr:hypothetical protein [Nitrososphaerota archaeon]
MPKLSTEKQASEEKLEMEFSSVTVAFLVHSTEDYEKLMKLVIEKLGIHEDEFMTEKMHGYFGNQIESVKGHVIGQRAQIVASTIFSHLSKNSRIQLLSELEKSIDEHDSLYLRVDRQLLEDNEIFLSEEEPIRVKIKPKKRFGGHAFMKREYEDLIE